MSKLWVPILVGVLLALPACEHARVDPPEPEYRVEVANESAGLTLSLTVNQTEISTADRIQVRARVSMPIGSDVRFEPVDWEQAGWIVEADRRTVPTATNLGRLSTERTWTLEPFLDGQTEIPPVIVTWFDDGPRTLQAAGTTVSVSSLLDETDSADLAPPIPSGVPEAHARDRRWIFAAAVVGAIAVPSLLWLARPTRPVQPLAERPESVIRRLASKPQPSDRALSELHRSIEQLARTNPNSFGPLLSRTECARFGTGSETAASLLEDAVALIESQQGERT